MSLEQWQIRLERHFEALAQAREDSGLHIFALEHGLNDEEIEEIASSLRSRSPQSPNWLPWVVYATERGYTYKGDEYWPSFEEMTPLWEYEDRRRLARWFRKFQKTYDSVVPCGRWADHFTIISWPISHAILPQYLQDQLARMLYELRYRFVSMATREPADIGRLLAANGHHTSPRLQVFLEQEQLAGRIVSALLGDAPTGGDALIYPRTLERIVEDLESVRSARGWLREAQRIVKDRFKGIGSGLPGSSLLNPRGGSAPPDASELGIRPKLLLVHRSGDTWSVRLEVPSFRIVAALSLDTQSFLRRTRCRLNGAEDFKPAGWLLSGNRKGALKSWPDSGKSLIQFEQSHGRIDNILETECRLSPGPVWLFRISSDGTARALAGHIVRPGYHYIVVTTGELPALHPSLSPCRVNCTGIKAFRLQIPSEVSTEDTAWLGQLGLKVARTIRVWPAGLPGRNWDGEGSSEWLTTEAPCFGMVHDHPVDAYLLCLNGGAVMEIEAGELGHPVFVRLAPLPVGKHTLTVKARRSSITPAADGFVELHVREPEPWISGVPSHGGLIVTLDPHDADLNIFWKNEVSLSVMGPEGRSVRIAVSLKNRNGKDILSKPIGDHMELPILPETWRNIFEQFLGREHNAWSYLEAASGQLEIRGDELGRFSFSIEHDIVPLRWVMRRDHGKIVARLIDDTGLEGADRDVFFFSMEHPLRGECCLSETALSGIEVDPPGGLLRAKHGSHRDVVIVSAALPVKSFQDLGVTSDFAELHDGSMALAESLRLYADWYMSRLFGPLVNVRQKRIVDDLLGIIYKKLCGQNWALAETAFRRAPSSQNALDNLRKNVEKKPTGFAAMLRCEYTRMDGNLTQTSQWYSDLAARYQVSTDRKLSDFALRLSVEPHLIPGMFGAELDAMLNAVRGNPVILRGARFLAVASQNQRQS